MTQIVAGLPCRGRRVKLLTFRNLLVNGKKKLRDTQLCSSRYLSKDRVLICIYIYISILHFIDHVPIPNSGGRGRIKNINGTCIT